ncbi:Pkinase-domain-containing protein [Acaromyces ingoldii]|uniref:cyclin-dependent kinase n=1 Tax=Acaromyces ingoldii TaxID=215250 RepID=A0A316YMN2_9BASI|nr:Pkinase-domain-containing protein [Acaromyces ingoldii]PWN90064.1 Pkinase-domain-containing protein [Acaromyces ingoldii]
MAAREREEQATGENGKARASSSAASEEPPPRTRPPSPPPVPPREAHPGIAGCRSVYCYERLNHIEEGSYGVVFRARDKETGEIVALKKLKMDKETNGFPITSLREIRTLMEAAHENVVRVREIVVGDTLTQIFIVMDFIEHDLKTLLHTQTTPFLASEVKTLMRQLLSAISLLHRNWIIHRDLKTSNLLMNNRGQIKLADFGLARMYGEPTGEMTPLVVTLWYRAPELLLGAETYDTAIDMWSIGCIFAELITKDPLLPARNETEQIYKIFRLLGYPTEDSWPGVTSLPNAPSLLSKGSALPPYSQLRKKFPYSTEQTIDLLQKLLTLDPRRRITADEALQHPYFRESPAPAHPDTFGSFPSVAAGERKRSASPNAPHRVADQKLAYQLEMDL